MPAYITHTIFGQELYQEYLKCNQNRMIDSIYMTQYALGPDLSRFTESYKKTHQMNTRDFLMTMIWYIKEYKLDNDEKVLGILFGHISHYFLDINMHPLIYYNAKGCETVGIMSPHTLIEGFLDEYFKDNRHLGTNRYLEIIKTNERKYNEIIEYTYNHVYQEKRILMSMKKTLIMLSGLEMLTNTIPNECLIKIARFRDFLEINKLSREEILNSCHAQWKNPVTGDRSNKSCEELYCSALDQTINAMKITCKYFDNLIGIDQVEKLFRNLSYNTGVDLTLGQNMRYMRKKVK